MAKNDIIVALIVTYLGNLLAERLQFRLSLCTVVSTVCLRGLIILAGQYLSTDLLVCLWVCVGVLVCSCARVLRVACCMLRVACCVLCAVRVGWYTHLHNHTYLQSSSVPLGGQG